MDAFQWLEGAFLNYKQRHAILRGRSYSLLCEESNGTNAWAVCRVFHETSRSD